MRQPPARRLLLPAATLLTITIALYAGVRALPGSPAWGEEAGARPAVERWLARQHVADPLPVGYLRWLADLIRLDLGVSLSVQPGRPVLELIGAALPWTCLLGLLAILMTLGLAVPLGGLAALRPQALASRASAGLLYALHALPVFVVALLLQQTLAGRLGLLPGSGPPPELEESTAGWAPRLLLSVPYYVLPVLSLALGSLAFVIRLSRASFLQGMARRWAEAASARGAARSRVIRRHALGHAALPLISLLGLMLPAVAGGSVMVETVFALPGMGRLFFTAVGRRDYPVIMAISLLVAAATLAAGAISDALYRIADPRMRDGRSPEAAP